MYRKYKVSYIIYTTKLYISAIVSVSVYHFKIFLTQFCILYKLFRLVNHEDPDPAGSGSVKKVEKGNYLSGSGWGEGTFLKDVEVV